MTHIKKLSLCFAIFTCQITLSMDRSTSQDKPEISLNVERLTSENTKKNSLRTVQSMIRPSEKILIRVKPQPTQAWCCLWPCSEEFNERYMQGDPYDVPPAHACACMWPLLETICFKREEGKSYAYNALTEDSKK